MQLIGETGPLGLHISKTGHPIQGIPIKVSPFLPLFPRSRFQILLF
jgi:hypothetical protein